MMPGARTGEVRKPRTKRQESALVATAIDPEGNLTIRRRARCGSSTGYPAKRFRYSTAGHPKGEGEKAIFG